MLQASGSEFRLWTIPCRRSCQLSIYEVARTSIYNLSCQKAYFCSLRQYHFQTVGTCDCLFHRVYSRGFHSQPSVAFSNVLTIFVQVSAGCSIRDAMVFFEIFTFRRFARGNIVGRACSLDASQANAYGHFPQVPVVPPTSA
jgi:hypothetical protein